MRRTFSSGVASALWSPRPAAALHAPSRVDISNHRGAAFSTSSDVQKGTKSSFRQYVSLYHYTPLPQDELPWLRRRMLAVWRQMDVRGRIYVSQEGVNAQVTMPQACVAVFADSFPDVFTRKNMFLGALIPATGSKTDGDAHDKETQELKSAARHVAEPFETLHVRIRDQIVRDGFEKGHLDLQDSGNALPPKEWHQRLQERNANQDDSTLVLDVRNFYEHEIGRFDGATRIMVDTFRDTFDAVDEILARHEAQHDGEKPKEVMMYCTGGIRCEKVGAYLAQYKGITNVHKLHGGIVNYMRFLQESEKEAEEDKNKAVESLFKGKNFVFDQRCITNGVDAVDVTPDVLGECFQCGEPCNQHTNCLNLMCGGLILQCAKCAAQFRGTCSDACKEELLKMNTLKAPAALKAYRKQHAERWKPAIPNALPKYRQHLKIHPIPPAMQHGASSFCTHAGKDITRGMAVDEKARLNAYVNRMSSGHDDEQLLAELREMTVRDLSKAIQLVDEPQGRLLSFLVQLTRAKRVLEIGCFTGYSAICLANGLAKDGILTTCDVDADTMRVAETYFARSKRASQIQSVLSDGMAYLDALGERRSTSTDDDKTQFDVIFVDANKRQYLAYYEAILEKQLLHHNGLLIFDNTLFRGRVLACDLGTGSKKERIAQGLANFNVHVASDPRTAQVLLPLWDGLTIVRQV
uniref:Rhodanese domain-containing protein n=1 Tax=Globisporangium ultimum (strain ATCC 200006 / CBS 805.95 / DAOM BR144) TaxID=431595 RepID=K3W7U1_GLOUD